MDNLANPYDHRNDFRSYTLNFFRFLWVFRKITKIFMDDPNKINFPEFVFIIKKWLEKK